MDVNNSNITIDHINRNTFDNRKINLRICTQQENVKNKSLSKKNTSGIIGVYWYNQGKKWRAEIKIDGKKKYLGSFLLKEDAIVTRLLAEKQYFGEFAPQQHLYEQYNIV